MHSRSIASIFLLLLATLLQLPSCQEPIVSEKQAEGTSKKVKELLGKMTLREKIGQLCMINGHNGALPDNFTKALREGSVGAILNEVDPQIVNKIQRIAVEESRLGIPLLIGRDVIHGYKTIFPIPLGLASSWDTQTVRRTAEISALEAASRGINWTFSPGVDVCRDPRWGRVAETFGEDPFLVGEMGKAMIRGYQGENLSAPSSIAACAKHFAGYGAAEGGRDYNTTLIPEVELRNTFLPPFQAAVEEGAATFMTGFNDLNGVPVSGNAYLVRDILRKEWGYDGTIVSDWESISQMVVHGFVEDEKGAALIAVKAGVELEMAGTTYKDHLETLLEEGKLEMAVIDQAVRHILSLKFRLGLFENPYTHPSAFPELVNDDHRQIAKEAAIKGCVLLKNEKSTLPLSLQKPKKLLIIGPMADDPYEQLGTWIFDGDPQYSVTPLQAIREMVSKTDVEVIHIPGLEISRSQSEAAFPEIIAAANQADVILAFVGEEAILSGEAHSRAHLTLPGKQQQLLELAAEAGKPLVTIMMAGRPLAIGKALEASDALLFAWHPGTMGGPAIADLLFGKAVPSGKLPITFPKTSGQIPIYYGHKNTGKPPTEESFVPMDSIPVRAVQYSLGNTSHYLDIGYEPLFPFGFGLSYTTFEYGPVNLSKKNLQSDNDQLSISTTVKNTGERAGEEIAQLYIRDPVSSLTRPVKELKAFKRIALEPGESREVSFSLKSSDLAWYYPGEGWKTENGKFEVFIGGDSRILQSAAFEVNQKKPLH